MTFYLFKYIGYLIGFKFKKTPKLVNQIWYDKQMQTKNFFCQQLGLTGN
jgi:hypothetical protein